MSDSNSSSSSNTYAIEEESFTIERLVDELYLCLAKIKSYDKHARYLIYRIPVYTPTPAFEIKISDLSELVKKELDDKMEVQKRD